MTKIAIIGGTGAMGKSLAKRFSASNEVFIGSRDPGRGIDAASKIPGARGGSNLEAANWCEIAIVTIPAGSIDSLREYSEALAGKTVVSAINPLRREGNLLQYDSLEDSSATLLVASRLRKSSVVAAFNNVPPSFVRNPPEEGVDVLIAAETRDSYDNAAQLVNEVPRMRPLYVGPLKEAESIERLTVLVLNAAALNEKSRFSVRFVTSDAQAD